MTSHYYVAPARHERASVTHILDEAKVGLVTLCFLCMGVCKRGQRGRGGGGKGEGSAKPAHAG